MELARANHTILGKTESARCAVPFKLRELADELEAGKIPKNLTDPCGKILDVLKC
jgi:hypothetical protein